MQNLPEKQKQKPLFDNHEFLRQEGKTAEKLEPKREQNQQNGRERSPRKNTLSLAMRKQGHLYHCAVILTHHCLEIFQATMKKRLS